MPLGKRGFIRDDKRVGCIADNTMVALFEGRLSDVESKHVHAHLDTCAACRALVAGAALALDTARDEASPAKLGPSSASPSSLFVAGQDIDHFHVLRPIGRGGMGEVYVARDTNLDRKVALKVIKSTLVSSAQARERFALEAKATARLNHPNIVTIHAIGQHDGVPYVALELLEGQTLRERLATGRLERAEVKRIGRAIAGALDAAHAAGVFHRDLKPSNVMLGRDGRVSVLDFGLAQLAESSLEHEQESLLLRSMRLGGTPTYMAPEQWKREPSGGASDIWALGVVLHEMLLGERPFEKLAPEMPTLAAEDLRARVHAIRTIVCDGARVEASALTTAGVSEGLAMLVVRCLHPDPAQRPAAAEVTQALEVTEEVPVSVPPVSSKGWVSWAVAALAALLSAGILLTRGTGRESASAATPPVNTVRQPQGTSSSAIPSDAANPRTAGAPSAGRSLAVVPSSGTPLANAPSAMAAQPSVRAPSAATGRGARSPKPAPPPAAPIPSAPPAEPKKEKPWNPMRYR